jgi:hypothetical protein
MKTIGIKLADGSFYPILEEGKPKKSILDLTTVKDNQTTVQIDLYRSEAGSIDDAEYVDTLKVTNLNPHPNGEPELHLSVGIDENDELSAEIIDPETGKKSETQVQLVSRTMQERNSPDDFEIAEMPPADSDFSLPENAIDPAELAELEVENTSEKTTESTNDDKFELPDFDDIIPPPETEKTASAQEITETDFTVPDFDDLNQPAPKAEGLEGYFDDPAFKDPVFTDPALSAPKTTESTETVDFTNLYTPKTTDSDVFEEDKEEKSKSRLPLITAIVCVILLLLLILILFVIPSPYNVIRGSSANKVQKTETVPEAAPPVEEPAVPQPETQPEAVQTPEPVPEPEPAIIPAPVPAAPEKKEDIRYHIKWGDTLWDISDAYYKNPWQYKKIARFNHIKNPDLIISGTYITVPAE